MQYMTIALELIQDRPELYEELRSTKRLLTAVEAYATELKTSHETWKEEIASRWPGSDPAQVASEALENAILDLTSRLPCASEEDTDPLTLDDAMSYIRRHSQPA
jgi:hypothetical protein